MNYADLQLRGKTFLDFTTDEAVIEEIVGDKEFFLAHVTEENRAMTFMHFTDYCRDKKLVSAIEAEFGKEYDSIRNE